jgi:hypothetical protein
MRMRLLKISVICLALIALNGCATNGLSRENFAEIMRIIGERADQETAHQRQLQIERTRSFNQQPNTYTTTTCRPNPWSNSVTCTTY